MKGAMRAALVCVSAAGLGMLSEAVFAAAPGADVKRGEYLVNLGGCNDCHTPKSMTPNGPAPDATRLLSGHRSTAKTPAVPAGVLTPEGWAAMTNAELTAWAGPWGVSFAANLTPSTTGLGAWTEDQFIKTMRTGKHLGVGRQILPPMPWPSIGQLTDPDLKAIFAYLKSIKAVDNVVPGPLPPK